MINRSAGEPKRAPGSARRAGLTWPCGHTSGTALTEAYNCRAKSRCVGSGSKQRSGDSVHRFATMICFPLLALSTFALRCREGQQVTQEMCFEIDGVCLGIGAQQGHEPIIEKPPALLRARCQ